MYLSCIFFSILLISLPENDHQVSVPKMFCFSSLKIWNWLVYIQTTVPVPSWALAACHHRGSCHFAFCPCPDMSSVLYSLASGFQHPHPCFPPFLALSKSPKLTSDPVFSMKTTQISSEAHFETPLALSLYHL